MTVKDSPSSLLLLLYIITLLHLYCKKREKVIDLKYPTPNSLNKNVKQDSFHCKCPF